MELFNRDTLESLIETLGETSYYLPRRLFATHYFANVRLETKMAYVGIMETLIQKPLYDKQGRAYVKMDNPEIIHNLEKVANKEVSKEKMETYFKELVEANLIEVEGMNIFILNVDQ